MSDPITQLIEQAEREADRATYHTPAEILAYEPDPSHTIAGKGWLRRGACTLLTAGTGMGKSVLAMQMCVCVAAGVGIFRKLCGGIAVPRPARVLYVQAENDLECLQRYLAGVLAGEEIDGDALADRLIIATYPGDTPRNLGMWLLRAIEKTKPDLVCIDPYQSFTNGDINSTESFFQFRDAITPALRNAALLLVCHTPKPRDRTEWTARESVYLAAGTSALANWARCSCELTNPLSDQDHRYRLRFGKNAERAGLPDQLGGLLRRDVWLEHSDDRERPYWVVSDDQSDASENILQRLRALIEEHPGITQRRAAEILGVSLGRVNKLFKQVKDDVHA